MLVLFLLDRAKYCDTAEFTCNCISSFISFFVHLLYKTIIKTFTATSTNTTMINPFPVRPD